MALLVDTILKIAEFAEQNLSTISEMDINPLMVTPHGAIAADALIRGTMIGAGECP